MSFFPDDPPDLEPDYEAFALSLDVVQAGFLLAALMGSQNKKYFPLREALQSRVLDTPKPMAGVKQAIFNRFYRRRLKARAPTEKAKR